MKLAIVANTKQKQELLSRPFAEGTEIVWLEKPALVPEVVGYIDLLFEEGLFHAGNEAEKLNQAGTQELDGATPQASATKDKLLVETSRLALLAEQQSLGSMIIVSAVMQNCADLPNSFIRMNGWNSFLDKERMEMTGGSNVENEKATQIIASLNRKAEWVPDQIGFIAPRVIASIINEAYTALQEGVSDKKQIDTAMKLGTNYPMGPFAWAEKIGIKKIYQLLSTLSHEDVRYHPAQLLTEEANN